MFSNISQVLAVVVAAVVTWYICNSLAINRPQPPQRNLRQNARRKNIIKVVAVLLVEVEVEAEQVLLLIIINTQVWVILQGKEEYLSLYLARWMLASNNITTTAMVMVMGRVAPLSRSSKPLMLTNSKINSKTLITNKLYSKLHNNKHPSTNTNNNNSLWLNLTLITYSINRDR